MSSRFREGFCLKNKVESARGRHNIDLSSTCTHRKLSGKRYGEDQKKEKETDVQKGEYTYTSEGI